MGAINNMTEERLNSLQYLQSKFAYIVIYSE